MLKNRVIPCLLLQNGGLVKTYKFSKPKYVGDPINAIRIFNEKEVDEIIVLDIAASRNNLEPDYSLIEQFAGECFMPLCYGGGIQTIEQAIKLFSLGVEKVSLQSAAMNTTRLVSRLSEHFGSQSVVVSVDVKRNWFGKPYLYQSKSRKAHKQNLHEYLQSIIAAGAGEIVLNSVDKDGTMQGMDLELIRQVSDIVSVPLIAMGGVGHLNDIKAAIASGADAVGVGAFFVFHGPHRAVLITYPQYQELENLLRTIK